MEQRDLIKDQTDQLGKVLAKILSNFLGFNNDIDPSNRIEKTNHDFQNELDIDIEKVQQLSKDDLKSYLSLRLKSSENIEYLAEYFIELGKKRIGFNKNKSQNHFEKALQLIAIANELSNTISLDRINKKIEILGLMNDNNFKSHSF